MYASPALTLKLCVEVGRAEYEFSLNPGNENWKLEMETPKFPVKIDFNFYWDLISAFVSEWRATSWVNSLNKEDLCQEIHMSTRAGIILTLPTT